jgi:hypothetical protein
MRCTPGSRPRSRSLFAWLLLLLVLGVGVAAAEAPKAQRSSPAPDGVCYPVHGTGYIVTAVGGLKIPIGTLSPLVAGDSLIVQTGTVTFLDFRTGQSPVYGAGSHLTIAPVKRPKPPPWWQRLEDHIVRSLSGPEKERIVGSVRWGGMPAFWPDGARFAPGVPCTFEWGGVHPAPAFLQVCANGDTTECAVAEQSSGRGVFVWHPPAPVFAGPVTWVLLDAARDTLGGGRFVVLTPEAAEAERQRFANEASSLGSGEPQGLTAAVLAEADQAYLW